MATRKYFTEKGIRALPKDSIPHSKFSSLILDDVEKAHQQQKHEDYHFDHSFHSQVLEIDGPRI